MAQIYITGHRNPDIDSVCAALSYADLKNKIDPSNKYIPVRCGHLSDSVKKQLEAAGVVAPPYMRDIRPKVGDVLKQGYVSIEADAPLFNLFKVYDLARPSIVPVFDNGRFYGLLSIDDITSWFLKDNTEPDPVYTIPVKNIKEIIPGKVLHEGENDTLHASLLAGAASLENFFDFVHEKTQSVIIMGYRQRHIEHAIKMNVPAIIITATSQTPDIDFSGYTGFVYQTEMGTAEAIRRLRMAPSVRTIMGKQAQPVQSTDLFDDVKEALTTSNLRGFPVFNGTDWVGFVTRRCFLDKPRYQVILVDHNEASQSIKGLDEADVREIIDHHRLDAPKTSTPIFIDAEPLGSANTIIWQNFRRRGITPDPYIARVMLTGIVCDTLILKSPTTTQTDIDSVKELAQFCGENDVDKFGRRLFSFSESLSARNPDTVVASDFKLYSENGVKMGVGQCEVPFLDDINSFKDTYLAALENIKKSNALDWTILMITDVLRGDSILLTTASKFEKKLSYAPLAEHVFNCPGVLSRKKQLLPEILHAIS
jgi:manganese-dependent inorganic pyrophosphatase